jgi:HD-GYP domain-containing protein (c-di-GMP phosphodiesterase class II)
MKIRNLTVSTDELRLGMYVAELDRPWLRTPFPLQGILVNSQKQINHLRQLCRKVVIDIERSDADSIEHLPVPVPVPMPDVPGPNAADKTSGAKVERSMSNWWEGAKAALFRLSIGDNPPKSRLAGIPADVELVVYHDTKSFDEAIGPAREIYREIEATMKMVMGDLAERREISVDVLSMAAAELVESVAVNPEAMIWLIRMREQNVRTYKHSVEVAIYMITFGRHLGFPAAHLEKFCMIGLLLDVGMTRVDNALLEKASPLSENELAEIRRHVDYSLEMLANSPDLDLDVREAIAQHHERIDGSGYPRGLVGDEISFAGRMAAIADTFAALTSHRPYAESLSAFKSMKVLSDGAGKHFSEPLVEQFVQAIGFFPVGSLVELSSGEVAAVVSHNKVRRLKPRLLILTDVNKEPLGTPFELNLLLDPTDGNGDPLRIWRGLPARAYGVNPRDFFLK